MRNKLTITISSVFLLLSLVCAQDISARSKSNLVVSAKMTGTGYYGDLNHNAKGFMRYFNVLPGVQADLRSEANTLVQPALSAGYGKIIAQNPDLSKYVIFGPLSDPDSYFEQPRYVRTNFLFADANLRLNPLRNPDALLNPYVTAGFGALLYFPFKNDTLAPKGLNLTRGESFSTLTTSLPFSLGTDINLGRNVSLNLGTSARMPMNDYIDLYGAKLVPDRMRGNDWLFSFQVGANIRLNKTTPAIKFPRLKDALPEDTTLLASADPHAFPIYLTPNPDFLAAKSFSLTEQYPDGWVRLTVLAQSVSCDSIARLADERIVSLYTENLQLRTQYKRLESEVNKPYDSMLPQVAEQENSRKVDSLIRVVYSRENKVRELQAMIDNMTVPQQPMSLGESEKAAQYEKEILALREELASMQAGGSPDDNRSVGFMELQEKYSRLEQEKNTLDEDYARLMEQNANLRKEVEAKGGNDTERAKVVTEDPILRARIDSLVRENDRLIGEFNALKKNYLVLQQDFDDLKNESKAGGNNEEVVALRAQNAELLTQVEALTAERNKLTGENLADLREKLTQSVVYVDSMNARYERLQEVINRYELQLAYAKSQNDSLSFEAQKYKKLAETATTNPGELNNVREESYVAEIQELRNAVQAEQEKRRTSENDLMIVKERNAYLQDTLTKIQANMQDVIRNEMEIAQNRIEELEDKIKDLQARKVSPDGTEYPADVVAQLENQIEILKRDKDELTTKNEELRRKNELIGASNMNDVIADLQNEIDSVTRQRDNFKAENETLEEEVVTLRKKVAAVDSLPADENEKINLYVSQIAGLTRERDSLFRVTKAFEEEQGDDQVVTLQQKLQIAEAQRDELKALVDKINNGAMEPLQAELKQLRDENGKLVSEKYRLEQELAAKSGELSCEDLALQIKQLEGENEVMRAQIARNVADQEKLLRVEEELVQKSVEIENYQRKLKEMSTGADNDLVAEKEEELITLTNQYNALQMRLDQSQKELAVARNELSVMERKTGDPNASAKIQNLESQIAAKDEEIAMLKSQQSASPSQPGDKKDGNAEAYKERIALLESENGILKSDRDNLVLQLKALKDENPEAGAYAEKIAQLEGEKQELEAKLKEAQTGAGGVVSDNEQLVRLTDENKRLSSENLQLKSYISGIEKGTGNAGDNDALLAELNGRVLQLEDENKVLRENLRSLQANGGSPDVAEMEEKMLMTQNQNLVLMEERDRYLQMYKELFDRTNAGEGGNMMAEQMQMKDEKILQLNNQVEALEIELKRAKLGSPSNNEAELAQAQERIAVLQRDLEAANKKLLQGETTDASDLIAQKDAEIARLNNIIENTPGKTGGSDPEMAIVMQENMTLKEDLRTKDAQIENLKAAATNGTMVAQLTAEVATAQETIKEQQQQIGDLETQLRMGGNNLELEEKVSQLQSQVSQKDVQIADLESRLNDKPESVVVQQLRGKISTMEEQLADKDAEISRLKTKDTNPVPGNTDKPDDVFEEMKLVRNQNQELFTENENLRTALSNALRELQARTVGVRVDSNATGDNDTENLVAENQQLKLRLTDLEAQLSALKGGSDHDLLVSQNDQLLRENETFKQRIADLESRPVSGGDYNAEVEKLRTDNSNLNAQIMGLEADVRNLRSEVETYKNVDVSVTPDAHVAQMQTKVNTLEDQLEKNATYIDELLTTQKQNQNRIADLERDLANAQNGGAAGTGELGEVATLKTQISTLKDENAMLNRQIESLKLTTVNSGDLNSDELARRANEVAARERRMNQREAYIEVKEEELALEMDRVKGIKAYEVDLRRLEQELKGFLNYNGEVMQDGSPCFPVGALIPKDEVMGRINDYFTAAGYKFEIVDGKMIYRNVTIPEIDKSKALNIAFYIMVSSLDNSKRVLQGSFQYEGDKTYITSEKYPAQSIRAIKLLQKLSQ